MDITRHAGFWVVLAVLAGSSVALGRTWTDSQGRSLEAKFVRVFEGNAILLRAGKIVSVPLSKLSEEDRDYIRQETGDTTLSPASETTSTGDDSAKTADGGADARTWTDLKGNQLEGEFVKVTGDNVVLRHDGKTAVYPLKYFSPTDQDYVRRQLKARGEGRLLPSASRPSTIGGNAPSHPPRWGGSRPSSFPGRMEPPKIPSPPKFTPPRPPNLETHKPIPRRTPPPSIPRPPRPTTMPHTPTPPRPVLEERPQMPEQEMGECSACKRVVSGDYGAGDCCPHCGTFFAYETDQFGKRKHAKNAGARAFGYWMGRVIVLGVIATILGAGFRWLKSAFS